MRTLVFVQYLVRQDNVYVFFMTSFFNVATTIQTIRLTLDNTMLTIINTNGSNQWRHKT